MTTRSSLRSLRIAATLTALVGLLAVSAAPVLGKEGMEAQLTTPVRLDTPPGTALTVAWTILVEGEDGRVPVTGMPVFLRFVPPGSGAAVEVIGNERPADSGHFTATLVVPAGGIARVEVGIHNTSCVSGSCTEGDMLFDLTDDSLVSGAPTGARADAAVPMASAAYTPVQPASAPLASTSQADATGLPIPLVGLGVALAAIAALGIGLVDPIPEGAPRREHDDRRARAGPHRSRWPSSRAPRPRSRRSPHSMPGSRPTRPPGPLSSLAGR